MFTNHQNTQIVLALSEKQVCHQYNASLRLFVPFDLFQLVGSNSKPMSVKTSSVSNLKHCKIKHQRKPKPNG